MSKILFKNLQVFFKRYKNKRKKFEYQKGEVILVDFNGWPGTHVAQLLIANIFSQIAKKKIIGFSHNFFFHANNLSLKLNSEIQTPEKLFFNPIYIFKIAIFFLTIICIFFGYEYFKI